MMWFRPIAEIVKEAFPAADPAMLAVEDRLINSRDAKEALARLTTSDLVGLAEAEMKRRLDDPADATMVEIMTQRLGRSARGARKGVRA